MTLNGVLSINRTVLTRTLPFDDSVAKKEIIPMDEFLSLDQLAFKMTKLVMLEVAYEGQRSSSYREASEELSKKLGYKISTSLVRDVTIFVGNIVYQNDLQKALKTEHDRINSTHKVEKGEKKKGILNILMDGATLNTIVKDKKGSTWRENKLGMSFASTNVIKRGTKENNGYTITKKEYTAYVGSVNEFSKFLYQIAINQGYGQYETTNVLGDGALWIWNLCDRLFPDAQQILDKYHLDENIYNFAKYAFKHNESQYAPWAKKIINLIMDGQVSRVYIEIDNLGIKQIPKNVVDLKNYIKNNESRIDYPTYKAKGYYIGSGPIESANKTVLQKRFKQAGMRWSVESAQPLLTLRAKVESGLWSEVIDLVMRFTP